MISPLGRGHKGGILSITSSRGSSGGAQQGALGPAPTAAAEGLTVEGGPAVEEGPTATTSAAKGPCGSRRGAGGGGRRALEHPRPKSVGSSRLCHLRILKKSS